MTTPTPEDIRAQYGFVAMLAQSVPEIGALMQQAVSQQWTQDRFAMAVANTAWWRSTPAPTRQWVTQMSADPASADMEMRTGGEQILQVARQLGFYNLTPEKQMQLWLGARLHGYDASLTREWVFNQLVSGAGPEVGGQYGQVLNSLRQMAARYGYRASYEELVDAARPLMGAAGEIGNISGWQAKMVNYAKGKFAPYADRFDAGETVMDVARPFVDTISQVLEVSPESVTLEDPYLQRWLQGRSEAGKPPAATAVWQAEQELRTDPRWGYTQNARKAAAQVATSIGKAFGVIG